MTPTEITEAETELQRLMTLADIRHFKATEYGHLRRPSWTGPRRAFPDNLARVVPMLVLWDLVRTELGQPITLSSTYRPPEYNTQDGQSDTSYHIHGVAGDGAIKGTYAQLEGAILRVLKRKSTITQIAERCGLDADTIRIGFGSYPDSKFAHLDVTSTDWDIWSSKRRKTVTRFK